MDSGLFTPLGLQPTAVCRLGFNAAGRWLAEHAISHRRLVADYRTGFVVWSAQLIFDRPVSYFDGDCLAMRVQSRIRGSGTQLESEIDLLDSHGATTRMQACCVPLRLDGDAALSGIPARLSPEVMARFRTDEIEARPHLSPVPALRAAILSQGTELAEVRIPFVIHRHQCEVADQWYWPEAVSLATAAREQLVAAEGDDDPHLRQSMLTPVRRMDLLFNRPFFLLDEGAVRSTAHRWQDRLVFIHEMVGSEGSEPRAVAIEQFAVQPEGAWH